MSTVIDERVVSMQFDNSKFEKNVSTTMSTLDKLKQKLNLDGAAKSFENIDSAAKKVNLSGLSNAADSVVVKFSHMQMTIQHQLDRIVDSAVDTGTRLAKALSVDQIAAGWDKFGKKTTSVATLKAQGFELEEVNEQLDRLNWFTDETSYNFTDMVENIAKFTATGKGLTESVNALEGIATWAALSGQNAQTASRAMYQISQAMGSGTMRREDYKSIQNASMDTDEFRQKALDAAVALKTLKKNADGTYSSLVSKSASAQNFTKSKFADSLTEGMWFTSEVMMEVFSDYSAAVDEIYKITEERGLLASEVMDEIHEKAEKEGISTNEAIKALGYSFDEFSLKAFEAGQKARTFQDAIDSVKDAVSTGWMNTFEIIFGDADQATKIWTGLANALWEVFASGAEVRNFITQAALDISKPWTTITEKLGNVTKVVEKVKDATDVLEYFQEVVDKVWNGDYRNTDTGRRELLTAAGYDPNVVQYLVNLGDAAHKAGKVYRITSEDIENAHKEFGLTLSTTAEETEALTVALEDLSDEKLREVGLTEEEIDLYKALQKEAKETGTTIERLVDDMSKNDGRTMLFEGIDNIGNSILEFAQIIKDAFAEIFNPPGAAELAIKIYNLIKSFRDFTKSLRLVDEETGELTETGDKISRVFKGMFSAVNAVITILKGPTKLVFSTIGKILSAFGTSILDVLATLGDAFTNFNNGVETVVDGISTFISENVVKWINEFKETEFFKSVAQWITDASNAIRDAIDTISNKISNFKLSPIIEKLSAVGNFFKNLAIQISQSKLVTGAIDGVKSVFTGIKDLFSKIPKFTDRDYANAVGSIDGVSSVSDAISSFAGNISSTIVSKAKTFVKNVTGIPWDQLGAHIFQKFTDFWLSVRDKVSIAFGYLKQALESIKLFIFGTDAVRLSDILNMAEKILGIVVLIKALNLVNGVIKPFDNITSALDNLASSMKWKAISSTFQSMALALAALTLCIIAIVQIDDMEKAKSAAIMLGSLIVTMGLVAVALGWASTKLGSDWSTTGVALSLLAMVGALALLVYVIKQVDTMTLKDPSGTFFMITGALLALVIGMKAVAKAGGYSFKSIAAILTLITALKQMLDVIEAYDEFDWAGKGKAIERVMNMMLGLSAALFVISLGGSGGSVGLAITLIAMVVSLKLVLSAIEAFAEVDEAVLNKGLGAVLTVLGAMTIMGAALNLTSGKLKLGKGERSVNALGSLALALIAVVAAVWILGKLAMEHEEELIRGGNIVAQILLAFTSALGVIGFASKGLSTGTITAILVTFAVLLAELAIIFALMKDVPVESSLATAGALGIVLAAMSTVLSSLSKGRSKPKTILKWVGILLALSGIIAVLSIVLYQMQSVNPASAIGSAVALSALLLAMSGVLHIISALDMRKLSTQKMTKIIAMMFGLTAVLFTLALVLNSIRDLDPVTAMGNVVALSVLLVVMTGVLTACSLLSNIAKKNVAGLAVCIAALGLLGLVIWEIGGIINNLQANGFDGSAIGSVTALSAMLIVMTGVVAACSALALILQSPMVMAGLGVAIVALGLLGLVIWEIGGIINNLQANGLDGSAIGSVMALSAILIVMTGVLAALALIGVFAVSAAAGVVVLAVLGLVVWEIGGIVRNLQSNGLDESSVGTVNVLTSLLNTLVDALAVLAIVGPFAAVGVVVLGVLTTFMGALGVAALAIGLAFEKIAGLDKCLDTGIAVFEKLAGGLGKMISAFLEGAVSSLPSVGEKLGTFGEKIGTFADAMRRIDSDVSKGAGFIKDAIIAMGEASDSGKGIKLDELAKELNSFANNIGDFTLAMDTLNLDSVSILAKLFETLNNISATTVISNATQLGEGASDIAASIKTVCQALSGLTEDDVTNVKRAAAAGEALAELNACIPKSGGTWQSWAGEQDIGEWGKKIVTFGDCLIAYSRKVSGGNIDSDAIQSSATAAGYMTTLNENIPATGGLWQYLAGNVDFDVWGKKLVSFADSLIVYSRKVSGQNIDKQAILNSAEAASALADVNTKIPTTGGLWEAIAGGKDLTKFGEGLTSLATGLVDYANSALQIDSTKIEAIKNSGAAIDELKLVSDKLPDNGGIRGVLWGNKDPESFGHGLSLLATGIIDSITCAEGLPDDATAKIQNLGAVIDALEETIGAVEWVDLEYIKILREGVVDLKTVLNDIKIICSRKYDFSNLTTISTELNKIDLSGFKSDAILANTAANHVKNAAATISSLNDNSSYYGVDLLVTAISNLAAANISGVISTFEGKSESMTEAIGSVIDALTTGIDGSHERVITSVSSLVNSIIAGLSDEEKLTKFKASAITLVAKFIEGLDSTYDSLISAGDSMSLKVHDGVSSRATGKGDTMETAGKDLGNGLIKGINAKKTDVYWAGYYLGQKAVEGEKDGQESNSPSKATIRAGGWLGKGLIIGINNMGSAVYNAGKELGVNAVGSIAKSVRAIYDTIDTDMDLQPTIRPVIDLSDVKTGVNAIGGMFSGVQGIGVQSNISAVNLAMNNKLQNRSENNIVSAINKLNEGLSNNRGETNIINGINVTEGTEAADAIHTLVRVIKMEGRS